MRALLGNPLGLSWVAKMANTALRLDRKNIMKKLLQANIRMVTTAILGLLALATMGQYANAQSSVQFRISENASVLKAALDFERSVISQGQYDQILMDASCQNPSSRLQARNRPYLMVQNTSAVPDTITSVLIDLTEPGFEFGDGDVTGDGFDGLLAMLATRNRSDAGVQLTSASYGANRTQLRLNFSGLSQGQAAIVRFDIDEPNGVFMFPDYRVAMQGADRGNGNGELAAMTTTFGSTTPLSTLAVTTFPQAVGIENAGHAQNYHTQELMTPPIASVPEPTSVVLLLSSFAGIASMRRRR